MRRLTSLAIDALRWLPALLLLAAIAVFTGLVPRREPMSDVRTAVGESWSRDGFTIAVVWPRRETPDFVEGARLAWEIANHDGPLAGKVRLRVFSESTINPAQDVAARVVRDGTVLAVLGHAVPEHIVPASISYERHGVLFLTPQGADPRATSHNFQYVFRLTPGDVQIGDAIAHYAAEAGLKRIGLISARTERGESASRQFAAKAAAHGLTMAFSRSYHRSARHWKTHDFRPLAAEVRRQEFDALVVADELPFAGVLIRDLVELGVTQPIISTEPLDHDELTSIAGPAARQVLVTSGFEPDVAAPAYLSFRTRFAERFGVEPTYGAALGYEAFMLAAEACVKSRSAAPIVLATTLRLSPSWHGLSGAFSFNGEGEVLGRSIAIKRVMPRGEARVYAWEGIEE